jgi:hypothetical protein
LVAKVVSDLAIGRFGNLGQVRTRGVAKFIRVLSSLKSLRCDKAARNPCRFCLISRRMDCATGRARASGFEHELLDNIRVVPYDLEEPA